MNKYNDERLNKIKFVSHNNSIIKIYKQKNKSIMGMTIEARMIYLTVAKTELKEVLGESIKPRSKSLH